MFEKKIIDLLVSDAKSVWPANWDIIEPLFADTAAAIAYDIIFRKLELFTTKGEVLTFENMRVKIGLFDDARFVFKRMLDVLCEDGILRCDENGYECIKFVEDIIPPAEYLVKAVRIAPEEGAAFQWLARSYDGLLQFIKGKKYGEEVMFPYNDFSLVEELYYTSAVYNYWSKLAGKTVNRLLEEKFKRKVTILEVGAGTGNGTYNVLNSLGSSLDKIERYIFTDISKSLIKKSKQSGKFDSYNFMEYKTFDLTKDIASQDLQDFQADIVLAVNVLHATPVLKESIKKLLALTAPGGVVVLGEIAPPDGRMYSYMELTFGLLASYYGYKDKEIRSDTPILRQNDWVELFIESGFSDAIAIPGFLVSYIDRGGVIIAIK